MSKIKVLTVESYNDSATRNMLYSIYQTDDFKKFVINHFYINGIREFRELTDKLSKTISQYEASYLLIHDGIEYFRTKKLWPNILSNITSQHPKLIIGIERRDKQNKKTLSFLSDGEPIKHIEHKFFCIRR